MTHVSYWIDSTAAPARAPLNGDVTADVAIIGAGIVGLTVALLLARAGRKVVVIDMYGIGHGASGHTTGKITAGHGLIYSALLERHDARTAQAYASANQQALRWIESLVEQENIDCDFEKKANYVYCEAAEETEAVRKEAEAAAAAGLNVTFLTRVALPFPVAAAVRLDDQAQFHARKYLLHLARLIEAAGGRIHEDTRAIDVEENRMCTVRTTRGVISADRVVMATHYPFADRGFFFTRVRPTRSYVVAGVIDPAAAPDGMFINAGHPVRSIRTIPDGDRLLLAVAGSSHSVGEDYAAADNYEKLATWMADRFGITDVAWRWSAQDGVTADAVPYAGTAWRSTERVFTATGFAKWGLTNGTACAQLIANDILGIKDDYEWLYDPHRLTLQASAAHFAGDNARVGAHFFKDRFRHPQEGEIEALAAGQAAIAGTGFNQIAAYKDESGRLHELSARCTHLGCIVAWNSAELTWDCPCHGSRFDIQGRVLEGPAVNDLSKPNIETR